jgi:hypothetical protein
MYRVMKKFNGKVFGITLAATFAFTTALPALCFADETPAGINPNYSCELDSSSGKAPVPVPEKLNFPVSVSTPEGAVQLISHKQGSVSMELTASGSTTPELDEFSTSIPYITTISVQGKGMLTLRCKPLNLNDPSNSQPGQNDSGAIAVDFPKYPAMTDLGIKDIITMPVSALPNRQTASETPASSQSGN